MTERVELTPVEIPGLGSVEDSRLKGTNLTHKQTHPTLPLERTFCTRCGKPFGWVSQESSEYITTGAVTVFCNPCEDELNKLGPIPLKVAAPDNATEIPKLRTGSLPSRLGE